MPTPLTLLAAGRAGGPLARPRRRTALLGALLALTSAAAHAQQPTATGRILLEQWTGVPGAAISGLIGSANYPDRPAQRDYPGSLELVSNSTANLGNDYGSRFRGYVLAPTNGAYTFWVAGDDNTELYLSSDDNPAGKVRIAYSSYTNLREWTKYPTQQSAPQTLQAGRRYYLEVLHKQGTQGSHVSVGWQLPDGTLERPIAGSRLSAFQVRSTVPAAADVLVNLTTDHPRLLGSALTFARVKQQIAAAGSASALSYAARKADADALLSVAPVAAGGNAVTTSREITNRVRLLSFVYRVSGESQYLNRAWTELNNLIGNTAPAWATWNPRGELLDVAELTTAASIGYDWLYEGLTTTQRTNLRGAIISKGLNVGLVEYRNQAGKTTGWSNLPYNWNAVCNSGFTMGSLVIAGEDATTDTKAREVLGYVLNTLPVGVSDFAPDGGWDEGPGYWNYATSRLVNLFASTEAAVGSSFGFADRPGLAQTGLYPLYINRPSGVTFNHADGSNTLTAGPHVLWMATRYQQPVYATQRHQALGNTANASNALSDLDLLWYSPHYNNADLTSLPLDRVFRSSEVAMLRSAWQNAQAVCVGLKAGNNKEGHEQLDVGTFVLDALGYKWAEELGNDSYELTNYFRSTKPTGWPTTPYRYDYYRVRAEGQNTLLINPTTELDQTQTLLAPITRLESTASEAYAVADLKLAYAGLVNKALRGVRLLDNRQRVLIQDEIEATGSADIWWQMHTRTPAANISIQDAGKSVMLTQGSGTSAKRLWLRIVDGPGTAVFATRAATLLVANPAVTSTTNRQDPNNGVTKLYVRMSGATTVRLAILAVPLNYGEAVPTTWPAVTSLSQWGQDLAVTAVSWTPAAPASGEAVTFKATIKNIGTMPTPAVKHGVAFKVDGATVSWSSYHVTSLAPGQQVTVTANGGPNSGSSTWAATPGGHLVTALVDDTDFIAEGDESNNTGTATLNVDGTLAPVHDAYVRAGAYATTQHGTTDPTKLMTKHNDAPDFEREAYLTFSLSGLPGTVTGAKLRVYKSVTGSPGGAIAVGAYAVAAPTWQEQTVSWNTKPTTVATPLATTNAPAAAGYVEWDVTSYVADQKSQGKTQVGFGLKHVPSAAETLGWNAKEAPTDRPQLVLAFNGTGARQALATTPSAQVESLQLYPNPARQAVTLELTGEAAQAVEVRLTSALGQVVQRHALPTAAGTSRHQLDISRLPNGLYLLTVQQGRSTTTRRLVVAR